MLRIWIRIRVKSRIRIGQIQKMWMLRIEPWRAVDASNGGLQAQNGAEENL